MLIAFAVLIFTIGIFIGFFIGYFFRRKHSYGGTIYVDQNSNKIVYTLELFDDPIDLKNQDQILFKVAPLDSRE